MLFCLAPALLYLLHAGGLCGAQATSSGTAGDIPLSICILVAPSESEEHRMEDALPYPP